MTTNCHLLLLPSSPRWWVNSDESDEQPAQLSLYHRLQIGIGSSTICFTYGKSRWWRRNFPCNIYLQLPPSTWYLVKVKHVLLNLGPCIIQRGRQWLVLQKTNISGRLRRRLCSLFGARWKIIHSKILNNQQRKRDCTKTQQPQQWDFGWQLNNQQQYVVATGIQYLIARKQFISAFEPHCCCTSYREHKIMSNFNSL